MDYKTFQSRLCTIDMFWNPGWQYLSKDLQVINRPRTCLQKLFAFLFKPSEEKSLKLALDKIIVIVKNHPYSIQNDIVRQRTMKIVKVAESNLTSKKWSNPIRDNCNEIRSFLEVKNDSEESTPTVKDEASLVEETSEDELSLMDEDSLGVSSLEEAKAKLLGLGEGINIDSSQDEINQALILARRIKRYFVPKHVHLTEEQRDLKRAYLTCQSSIFHQIFAPRITEGREYVKQLRDSDKLQGNALNYLDYLDRKLEKGKPVVSQDSHKWHHCTVKEKDGRMKVDPIINSQKILSLKERLYEGAYVSTHPEWGYGNFCFVFNSRIEDQITGDKDTLPLITNCETSEYPLYIGRRRTEIPNYENDWKIPKPTIWAGFKKTINFSMPDKKTSPLEYYSSKRLDLFVGDTAQLSKKSQRFLKRHRVFVMPEGEYRQFHKVVSQNFHLHFHSHWRQAPIVNSSSVLGEKQGVLVDA